MEKIFSFISSEYYISFSSNGQKKYPSIFIEGFIFYQSGKKKCIICPISIYNAQTEKNNLLVFPLVLNARIMRQIKSGVAENAYSKRIMFIVGLYLKWAEK